MKSICRHVAIVAALLAGAAAASSAVATRVEWTDVGEKTYVKVVEVEGHRYVVVRSKFVYGCGVSAVHAQSCPCTDAANLR